MKSRVQLSQRQNHKLTPQMHLAIRLLPMSSAELEREIDNALSLNPVLERVEEPMAQAVVDGGPQPQPDPDTRDDRQTLAEDSLGNESVFQSDWHWDTQPEPISLQAHLLMQWRLCPVNDRDRAIGIALIDGIDNDGYWISGYDDIRDATRFAVAAADAEIDTVRHLIQHFDPAGTGSRDLPECLNAQLDQLHVEADVLAAAKTTASGFLPMLARHGIAAVAEAGNLPIACAVAAAELLKTLNPKPGAAFHSGHIDYIEADFTVEKHRQRWRARALNEHWQRLRINAFYQSLARDAHGKDAAYLQQYLQEAQWLIAAVSSRQDTLLKVVNAIAGKQHAFLESGPMALQAMTQREIADCIGVHESSVSRACVGKYLATPHGLFELGRLFDSGVSDGSGRIQAASAIQARIAAFIKAESPQKPLSDARLEALLTEQGLPVARRTIAKYREALHIPASPERRKPA